MSMGVAILKTGSTLASAAASARVAIPTDSAGGLPRFIRVATTSACYIKLGGASVTAAAGDVLLYPGDSLILKVLNQGYIAAIRVAADGTVQISPIEDQ